MAFVSIKRFDKKSDSDWPKNGNALLAATD